MLWFLGDFWILKTELIQDKSVLNLNDVKKYIKANILLGYKYLKKEVKNNLNIEKLMNKNIKKEDFK